MNKKSTLVMLSFLAFILQITAQITIDSTDMPSSADIIHTSTGLNLDFINYQETGEDYFWDFSKLTAITQNANTFIGITDISPIYTLYFGNTSNLVKKDNNTIPIPGYPLTKQYTFLKNSNTSYNNAGVLYTISGIPIPLKYTSPDIVYHFPMEYENTGSSYAEYSIGLTNIGYIGKEISRLNTIDGWGTLTTPYGTFEVLRLKSEITEFDSIYLDSLGFGLPLYREYTEYSWLGKDQKLPLLQVTSSLGGTVVTYVDSLRFPSAINNIPTFNKGDVVIYPNPTNDLINIDLKLQTQSDIIIEIYNNIGVRISTQSITNHTYGLVNKKVHLRNLGLKNGIYLFKFITQNQQVTKQVVLY